MVTPTTPLIENGFKLFPETNSLSRLRYFFGQLLTQRDLSAEQSYHLRLQRLMQRESFGTGTVAGLRVTRTKNGTTPITAPARSVFVLPGLALDPDGRELILEKEECVEVADPEVEPTPTPFTSTTADDLAAEIQTRFAQGFTRADLDALVEELFRCGLLSEDEFDDYPGDVTAVKRELANVPDVDPVLEPPEILRDWLLDQLVGFTFIGLRYREIGAEPSPAVLDASCCGDVTCFPARTQQGVFIVTSREFFPEVFDPFTQYKLCIDANFFAQAQSQGEDSEGLFCKNAICECLLDGWRGVPPVDDGCGPANLPIVCLARVCWSKFTREDGDENPLPQITAVDNCGCRPLAPGAPMVRALIESLTGCEDFESPPRIIEIQPAEGQVFTQVETADPGFKLVATANAILEVSGSLDDAWQIIFYPQGGGTATAFPDPGMQNGPGNSEVQIVFRDPETSGEPSEGRSIEISFEDADPFDPGTYVWRFPNSGSGELSPDGGGEDLDGEPNPPNAVPSGDGQQGGAFEGRFVVTSGGGGGGGG